MMQKFLKTLLEDEHEKQGKITLSNLLSILETQCKTKVILGILDKVSTAFY